MGRDGCRCSAGRPEHHDDDDHADARDRRTEADGAEPSDDGTLDDVDDPTHPGAAGWGARG